MAVRNRPTLASAVVEDIRANQEMLVELTADLIGFDTTARAHPDDAARAERPAQEYLAARLESIGAHVDLFEPEPVQDEHQVPNEVGFQGRPQLVATIPGTCGGPSILLNGHIDVVSPEPLERWSSDPFEAELRDGRLYGRGACDMKGGVAAMVFAVERLAAAGIQLTGDVIVNTVTDEESSGAGAIAVVRHGVSADACIVPEPTGLDIWVCCRGTCLASIEIDGRAGHVEIPQDHWRNDGGVNAIEKAAVVLRAAESLSREWAQQAELRHPFLAPGQVVPVRIDGGDWPVTIPARCRIECDVTFLPCQADTGGWDGDVRAEIEAWIARYAATDPWLAEHPPRISWSMSTPSLEVSPNTPAIASLARALDELRHETRLSGLGSFYDGATFARLLGIPAFGFGPGSIKVGHTVDEFVPIDELVDCAAALALTLIDHCGVHIARRRPPCP
jgi:acetylornithine deacetylase